MALALALPRPIVHSPIWEIPLFTVSRCVVVHFVSFAFLGPALQQRLTECMDLVCAVALSLDIPENYVILFSVQDSILLPSVRL